MAWGKDTDEPKRQGGDWPDELLKHPDEVLKGSWRYISEGSGSVKSTRDETTTTAATAMDPSHSSSASSSPVADPTTPRTPESQSSTLSPTYPPRVYPAIGRQRSAGSIRRKPVPLELASLEHGLEANPLPTPSTIHTPRAPWTPATPRTPTDPPSYILPVDPPSYASPCPPARPRSCPHQHHIRVDTGIHVPLESVEELPRYAEDKETEPLTLAKSLWTWGWLCPLLWGMGMCILWIPLKPVEEEQDVEKAQKLEEMIVILRQVELKYARRCAIGFVSFFGILAIGIALGMVLPRFV